MASGASPHSSRKRKRRCLLKDLRLLNDKVEVRSKEEGFLGSWHQGSVIGRRRVGCSAKFEVEYDHLLADDSGEHIVDSVNVSLVASDDRLSSRGYIRPLPPELELDEYRLPFGLCVDVNHNEGWWEGVIFDYQDGSEERKVFFPDMGDEIEAPIRGLRVTQDWDEESEEWHRRGMWMFLELIEEYRDSKDNQLPVSIKQIWYDLRDKEEFRRIGGDWTCSSRDVWEELVSDAISCNLRVVLNRLFAEVGLPHGARKLLEFAKSANLGIDTPSEGSEAETRYYGSSSSCQPQPLLIANSTPEQNELCAEEQLQIEWTRTSNASNSDGTPVASSISGEATVSTSTSTKNGRNLSTSSSRRKQRFSRLPAGPIIAQEANYCPNAIVEYAQGGNRNTASKAKQHLLSVKWSIQYHEDEDGRIRIHFISPKGKCYYSLKQACISLVNSEGENPPLVSEKHEQTTIIHDEAGLSGYASIIVKHPLDNYSPQARAGPRSHCPKAIVDCYKVSCTGGGQKHQAVIKSAKHHLRAMGWKIEETVRGTGRCVRVYKSPGGRTFTSLRLACESCIRECDISVASKPTRLKSRTTRVIISRGKRKQTRQSGAELAAMDFNVRLSKSKSRKTAGIYSRLADTKKLTQPKHLRSSKRARRIVELTPQASQNHRLTVVSWLIDNNAILPREKVHYRTSKDVDPVAKGKITVEGIKCFCCGKVFSLGSFELHVGNKYFRTHRGPASSLFLADGRSLLDCQVQVMHVGKERSLEPKRKRSKVKREGDNDDICSACRYGGELILCDQCPSSFHSSCLGMKDVPDGDWFCPSCCCRICKQNKVLKDGESFVDEGVLKCSQCEYTYHIACLKNSGVNNLNLDRKGNWCCGKNCQRIFDNISAQLGIPFPVGVDDLTWTLLKSVESGVPSDIETEAQSYVKLSIALHVMHECFEPLEDSRTGRDVVSDVIFSKKSDLRRLDFRGFYTALLEKDDEVISVATIRILGDSVAEVPLVATRHRHRHRGMCRILMNVLEENLTKLGVKRLVLPAVPSMLNTWTGSFGFTKTTDSERLQFVDSIFLNFPGTIMCHKLLTTTESSPQLKEIPFETYDNTCPNGEEIEGEADGSPSQVSEVIQAQKEEELSAKEHEPTGDGISSSPKPALVHQGSQPISNGVNKDGSKAETDCSTGLRCLGSSKRNRSWDSGLLKYHRRTKRKI